jgi:hypothetical protein
MLINKNSGARTAQDTPLKFSRILEAAKTLTPAEFQVQEPEQWIVRRAAIERIMVEEQARKATAWDGELPSKNVWLWAEPGLGKSRWAVGQAPFSVTYKKNLNKWWDGFLPLVYKQVTIEDWHPGAECLSAHLKVWADRYPFIAEVKGSSLQMEPGRWTLIVTSNYAISECFSERDRPAIERRFSEVHLTRENRALIEAIEELDT